MTETTISRQADTSRPAGSVIAEFPSYPEAQELVDRLSDGGFPVEHVRIVGQGLSTVEQVTGRVTKGRATLAGAASGAWFGLLLALLLGLFVVGTGWFAVLLSGVLTGALWGAVFGFVAHWSTRGRRDFSSVQGLRAQRYEVQVDAGYADEAARLAARR